MPLRLHLVVLVFLRLILLALMSDVVENPIAFANYKWLEEEPSDANDAVLYTYERRVMLKGADHAPGYYGRWKQTAGIHKADIWQTTDSSTVVELFESGCYLFSWVAIPIHKVTKAVRIDSPSTELYSTFLTPALDDHIDDEERHESLPISSSAVVLLELPYAGERQIVNSTSTTLQAKPAPYCATGVWSVSSNVMHTNANGGGFNGVGGGGVGVGIRFENQYSPITAVTGLVAGSNRFQWNVNYKNHVWVSAEVEVHVTLPPMIPPLKFSSIHDAVTATPATTTVILPSQEMCPRPNREFAGLKQIVEGLASKQYFEVSPRQLGFLVIAVMWILTHVIFSLVQRKFWRLLRKDSQHGSAAPVGPTSVSSSSVPSRLLVSELSFSNPEECLTVTEQFEVQRELNVNRHVSDSTRANLQIAEDSQFAHFSTNRSAKKRSRLEYSPAQAEASPASFVSFPTTASSPDWYYRAQNQTPLQVIQTFMSPASDRGLPDIEVDFSPQENGDSADNSWDPPVQNETITCAREVEPPKDVAELAEVIVSAGEQEIPIATPIPIVQPSTTLTSSVNEIDQRALTQFLTIQPPIELAQCEVLHQSDSEEYPFTPAQIKMIPSFNHSPSERLTTPSASFMAADEDPSTMKSNVVVELSLDEETKVSIPPSDSVAQASSSLENPSKSLRRAHKSYKCSRELHEKRRSEFGAKYNSMMLTLIQDQFDEHATVYENNSLICEMMNLDLKVNPSKLSSSAVFANESYFGSPGLIKSVEDLSNASTPVVVTAVRSFGSTANVNSKGKSASKSQTSKRLIPTQKAPSQRQLFPTSTSPSVSSQIQSTNCLGDSFINSNDLWHGGVCRSSATHRDTICSVINSIAVIKPSCGMDRNSSMETTSLGITLSPIKGVDGASSMYEANYVEKSKSFSFLD